MKQFLKIALLSIFTFTTLNVMAQSEKADITVVFANKKLLNGTSIVPDATINQAEFKKQYKANKVLWDKAIAYLTETNLDELALGKYAITPDSSVYAILSENVTKTADQLKWESHRKYIDLQCVFKGAEQMQVSPLNALTITKAYDEVKDAANYESTAPAIVHPAPAGRLFLFFPSDGHRPTIKADGFDKDKKIVIKIAVAN